MCQEKIKSDSDKFKYVRAAELKFSPETIKTSKTIMFVFWLVISIAISAIVVKIVFACIRMHISKNYVDCQVQLRSLAKAMNFYAADHKGEYPKSLNDLVPHYVKKLPACPTGSSYGYEVNLSLDDFTIFCSGDKHLNVGIPRGFPQYSSNTGLTPRPKPNYREIEIYIKNSPDAAIIKMRENPNLKNRINKLQKGKTLLHIAVENNQRDVVRFLLDNNADPSIPDEKGVTPLDLAIQNQNNEIINMLKEAAKDKEDK